MLVLTRELDQKIRIGHDITIMVVAIRGNTVKLGIEAPPEVPVHRQEVYEAIYAEQGGEDAQADA